MKAVKILTAVAVLAYAGWRIFDMNASAPQPGQSEAHMLPLLCTDCGKSYAARVHKPPLVWKCRFCSKDAAVEARHCLKCDALFPQPEGESQACPKCGGAAVDLPMPSRLDDPNP